LGHFRATQSGLRREKHCRSTIATEERDRTARHKECGSEVDRQLLVPIRQRRFDHGTGKGEATGQVNERREPMIRGLIDLPQQLTYRLLGRQVCSERRRHSARSTDFIRPRLDSIGVAIDEQQRKAIGRQPRGYGLSNLSGSPYPSEQCIAHEEKNTSAKAISLCPLA
jgi:hypothetical protein